MTTMKYISDPEQLEVGREYWLLDKRTQQAKISECHHDGGHRYFEYRIWVEPGNNQAMSRWEIFGPLPVRTPPDFSLLKNPKENEEIYAQSPLPWRITKPNEKKGREIVDANDATVAKLTALDLPNGELIVKGVNSLLKKVSLATGDFHGTNAQLCEAIDALLSLDEKDALSPPAVGGLARKLLSEAATRLREQASADLIPTTLNPIRTCPRYGGACTCAPGKCIAIPGH